MAVENLATERGVVLGLVVLVKREGDAVVLAIEHVHEICEHIVIGPVTVQGEVKILGEPAGRTEDQLAQAGATLEDEVVHRARIEHRAQSVRQHHIALGDELVT